MPPKVKVTKESIVDAALLLARTSGIDAVCARSVATVLGCSTQPIFSNYPTIQQLKDDVVSAATALYRERLNRAYDSGAYPPFKATGMAYIQFAAEEPELYRLLYMSERRVNAPDESDWQLSLDRLVANSGVSQQKAQRMQTELWLYVHGIATMIATGYMRFSTEDISALLSDAFLSLKQYHMAES